MRFQNFVFNLYPPFAFTHDLIKLNMLVVRNKKDGDNSATRRECSVDLLVFASVRPYKNNTNQNRNTVASKLLIKNY